MKVLLDECVPKRLKNYLASQNYERSTVTEAGWSGKQNEELLGLSQGVFDVFVTIDTNLRYQQRLADGRIAILVLQSSSNRLTDLLPHVSVVVQGLQKVKPGGVLEISLPTLK
jgi:predicted nuclease of predicted toxin-antitoxin system